MTIDKQALREAATEATQGGWYVDYDFDVCHESGAFIAETHGDSLVQNAKFIAAANPSTVLALLDELEAKDKQIAELVAGRQNLQRTMGVYVHAYEEAKEQIAKDVEIKARLCIESNSLFDRLRAAEKRIAELEAREVTLPPTFWYEHDDLSRDIPVLDKRLVKKAIRAAGIKVKES